MAVSMSEDDLSSDVLIPVPLHPVRLRTRGYNQSERVGIVSQELLVRTRPTTSQVGLSAADRWINVRGAFQATGCLDGMAVLLIGDVMTTGATLQACAAACLASGAEQVRSLTVATGS